MSRPVIDSVVVDSGITQITVSGSGFEPAASAPSVRFNGTALTVSTFSDSQFVAALPGGLVSGTYLLEVQNSASFTDVSEFSVTIVAPESEFVGFYNLFNIFGYATNVPVSTTEFDIPAVGIGLSAGGGFSAQSGSANAEFRRIGLFLDEPLSGSANLTAYFKDVTGSWSIGPATISPGGQSAYSSTSVNNVNNGDVIVVALTLASGSLVIPSLRWVVYDN